MSVLEQPAREAWRREIQLLERFVDRRQLPLTLPDPAADRRRRRRRLLWVTALLLALLVAPVPWMHLVQESPPGAAWRLDGRLVVDGERVVPEGRWSWLTVGRPPLVAELLLDRLRDDGRDNVRDMRRASPSASPIVNEPLAAAVGLHHAGLQVEFDLEVAGVGSAAPDYPHHAVLIGADGERREVEASIAGRLSRLPVVRWFRGLALGRSHGLMVALTTYAHAADPALAEGLHVAGTGGIHADGTVTRIGGLHAKATAARRAGADLLFFPAAQAEQLHESKFDPGAMVLVPVETLDEAIAHLEWLRATR